MPTSDRPGGANLWRIIASFMAFNLLAKAHIARAMESRTPDDWSRDELLAKYERSVWTILAIFALVIVGLIIWVGHMVL